jgi:DNA-directed RNA polymerase specialized sigma24 family protein
MAMSKSCAAHFITGECSMLSNMIYLRRKSFMNAVETKKKVNRRSLEPLFSQKDYSIVRGALLKLSRTERIIVLLRHWERFELLEIAKALRTTPDAVERYLEAAYAKLRHFCEVHTEFSRCTSTALPMAA